MVFVSKMQLDFCKTNICQELVLISSGGTNSKISNFELPNSGIFELRTQRTLAQKSMSNSNLDSRTSNFRKNKMT